MDNVFLNNIETDRELIGVLGELLDDNDPDIRMTEKVRKGIETVYNVLVKRESKEGK